MKQKLIALGIILAAAAVVWAVVRQQTVQPTPAPATAETVSTFMVGEVTRVSGVRVTFKVGEAEFVARVEEGTPVTKTVNILGLSKSEPGKITDIKPATNITVWYDAPKVMDPSATLQDLKATKVEVRL